LFPAISSMPGVLRLKIRMARARNRERDRRHHPDQEEHHVEDTRP
jgi:hypothetical protein